METSSLVQTVVILAACVVFLAKQCVDAYSRFGGWKKKHGTYAVNGSSADLLRDLHKWHHPVNDPETGQPRFLWYQDTKDLREELKRSRESMDELRESIGKMNDSLVTLVSEIKSQHLELHRLSHSDHHKGSKQVG